MTAIDKILNLLQEGNYSTSEIAEKLKMPLGTVRSTVSLLTRMGLTEPVPAKKRGTPFRLTEEGKKKIEEAIKAGEKKK